MNTNWKISTLALAAILSLTTATAQKEDKDKTKDKKKSQTITIVRSGDSNEKMTVVVDGDKVTINGKPIEEFKDDDVKVITGDQFKGFSKAFGAPHAPMAFAGADKFFNWNSNDAKLGVSTEDGDGGAKITEVSKDGAAEKAGLKVGDVITKVNDFNVADADDLPAALNKMKPEDKVSVTYKRDGATQTTTATLDKNTHEFKNFGLGNAGSNFDYDFSQSFGNSQGSNYVFSGRKPRLGLQVQDVEDGVGVKVLDVNKDTPAEKAGLQKDDVITQINGVEVKGVDDVRSSIKDVKEGESVKVTYKRGGSTQTAEIKFPKPVKKASI
jgi:serine protease Do